MKLRTHGRRAVLTVHDPWNQSGRIEGLEEKVDDLLQRGFTGLVLQCEGVTQIDSRGLGQLVQVNAAIMRRGGHLQIVGLTRPLNDLLSVVRLTGWIPGRRLALNPVRAPVRSAARCRSPSVRRDAKDTHLDDGVGRLAHAPRGRTTKDIDILVDAMPETWCACVPCSRSSTTGGQRCRRRRRGALCGRPGGRRNRRGSHVDTLRPSDAADCQFLRALVDEASKVQG
jgi:anti-anti-sigma factor